ncbi:MAG: dihydrolipoamide acetyltransferase family protein [Spirochaetota bacterium]
MAAEIKMPRLSQTTDEVRFIRWLVQEGDMVKKGDPICEVETDKVTTMVESFQDGAVLKLLALPDSIVYAGTIIAILGEQGEKYELPEQGLPEGITTAEATGARFGAAGVSGKVGEKEGKISKDEVEGVVPGGLGGKDFNKDFNIDATASGVREEMEIKATPLVLSIARKKGIDLRKVRGSGPGGLITKQDIEDYERGLEKASKEKVPPEKLSPEKVSPGKISIEEAGGVLAGYEAAEMLQTSYQPVAHEIEVKEVKLSRNQLAVGRNLIKSKTTIPHYYLKIEVFTDGLLKWRLKFAGKDGTKASIYSFLIYAAARALKQHPKLNASIKEDGLIIFDRVNIGFAVSRGEELYAPVIRDADSKSIEEIDQEVKWLMAKVLNEKIQLDDISGGTFTVTNLGPYQVDEFYAIINPPQPGIIAVGRMRKTLFIDDSGAMSIRTACSVTGSFDHRIVNGASAAAFLEHFKKIIEEIQ